ncbi:YpoC family protein [Robertmurraya massiliosenegalensis]|uniref:YpoC family protein n=1 Tax=Robertmurraya TaxID=2837507 RepID=UPI0039A502E8
MNENRWTIPEELVHPFFFPEGKEIGVEPQYENQLNCQTPFIHDAAYFMGKDTVRPWETPEDSISTLLYEWLLVKEQLQTYFEKRNKDEALIFMRRGISYFIEFLHWTNGRPVILHPQIEYESLQIKPVNIKERFEFIMKRPNLFHSYMQLCELFLEQEKSFTKAIAMKKMKKP